ncbi:penicillin-binding protein [Melghirimyces profundicolus]|uniref:Penicillin-binding protein n=1 Tax=Melghirimyces profundicolus TaxID=1242148 RepID=A0A2T6AWI5_9BACL|nr:penicillin-binding transpeptidase domain-containing protein [Melghirimyces profundicolus]PTX48136.1 penicillin-binding protein [Melghirimyces profundicolus]
MKQKGLTVFRQLREFFRQKVPRRVTVIAGIALLIGTGLILTEVLFGQEHPHTVMQAYLKHWETGKYDSMYQLLSEKDRKKVSKKEFIEKHKDLADTLGQKEIRFRMEKTEEPTQTVHYRTTIDSKKVGKIQFDTKGKVVESEDGEWRVDWTPSMMIPGLTGEDQVEVRHVPGLRGEIRTKDGQGLAVNKGSVTIGAVPGEIPDLSTFQSQLSRLLDMKPEEIKEKLSKAAPLKYVPLKKVSPEKKETIAKALEVEGVSIQNHTQRHYPKGALTAHITGFAAPLTSEQLKERKDEGYREGDIAGRAGLEKAMEKKLRGKPGIRIAIVGPDQKEKRVLGTTSPQNGTDIRLTIDLNTQQRLYDSLKGDTGAFVALDPQTGAVLGAVSTPSYNPNAFAKGLTDKEYKQHIGSIANRFVHNYTPGSTMKPITAAIGLETGKMKPGTTYDTRSGKWQKDSSWGGYYVRRVDHPNVPVDLQKAMAWSDNIYFARVGLNIGAESFQQQLLRFGFQDSLPFPIPVTNATFSNNGKFKNDIQLADTAYGQGQLQVSPIFWASIYTAFVNDGNMLQPRLILEEGKDTVEPKVWRKNVISPETAQTIHRILKGVVTTPGGSGNDLKTPGVELAMKTGTAELKKSYDDPNPMELGWLATLSGKPGAKPDLLTISMVKDVHDRDGSHYLFPEIKKLLKQRYH